MSTLPQVPIINGKKTFIPLENNPATLETLAKDLGAGNGLSFYDVLSLTDRDLLSFVPRPVLSLIFISPRETYGYVRKHNTPLIPDQCKIESSNHGNEATTASKPEVMWIPQTIGHACGSMALIHALANGPARSQLVANSTLSLLLSQMAAQQLQPDARAQLLYDSAELEKKHMSAAIGGDSHPPDPHDNNALHFIAFVKDDQGKLWELEGGISGPILLGHLDEGEDVLSEKALRLGPMRFVEASAETGEIEISCVAVVAEAH